MRRRSEARRGKQSGVKGLWRGSWVGEVGAAAADAGAQRGQAEPSELQWRSGSPTFLWNTVFTLRSREEGGRGPRGGGREGDDARGRKSSPGDNLFREGVCVCI